MAISPSTGIEPERVYVVEVFPSMLVAAIGLVRWI